MYIGSVTSTPGEYFVFGDDGKVTNETLTINTGLLQIYLEALTNATDNKIRSEQHGVKCKRIEVMVSDSGKTKITNDGVVIPIEIDKKVGVYVPEMLFGMFLTSSNYDDTVERKVAGRNGIGICACNVYSKAFRVKIYDSKTNKLYEQSWCKNMSIKTEPKITKVPKTTMKGRSFVEVTYIPDFERFGMRENGYTNDTFRLMYFHTVIASMLCGVNIKFNNEYVDISTLFGFASVFHTPFPDDIILLKGKDSEAVIISVDAHFVLSFVNGIYTPGGGVHADAWSRVLFKTIQTKLETKLKGKISILDVKRNFGLFVRCDVDKPSFVGQYKDRLVSPYITEPEISDSNIKKILKWSVISRIKDGIKNKDLKKLKTMEKKKNPVLEAYDSSNKKGSECTLILTEGLSAKTFAVKGITEGCFGKKGRDYFGIFALRGKCLNVRNVTPESIIKNVEISGIVSIIGLKVGVDYTEASHFKSLKYGRILVISDEDSDGFHITSLIINFIHYLYPSLLQRKTPFMYSMMTPIIRLVKKNVIESFYTHAEYKKFSEKNDTSKYKHNYFKGLGTSDDTEIKECFGKRLLKFTYKTTDDDNIKKAFQKDLSNLRKEWIMEGKPPESDFIFTNCELEYSISSYINNQLIEYSIDDCKRSLPNIIDGLKESQRKILYAAFLKNLKEKVKVAQFSGFIGEKTNYHHGENNLCETIIGMAQDFVGSNNIPLFERHGQFGSRISGGKDAAKPRYIFTALEKITRLIFKQEDDDILNYLIDEGECVEPSYYIPIIPMILVNGCEGIGTGWSCSIPCYNPTDIIANIRSWLDCKPLSEMKPWYKGYKGRIEKSNETKYTSHSIVTRHKNKIRVTELPIGMWTDVFKVKVDKLLDEGTIRSRRNNCTSDTVDFEIDVDTNFDTVSIDQTSFIHCSNLVCFDKDGKIKKYKSVVEILEYFCKIRLEYYAIRKTSLIKNLEHQLVILNNKLMFILQVIDKTIPITEIDDIDVELEKRKFYKVDSSYRYLTQIPMKNLTKTKIKKLQNDIEDIKTQIDTLQKTSEKQMWLDDISAFENLYSSQA